MAFDLMSMFGGGDLSGLGDLLTEEQKKAIAQQSMLAMGAQLLKASAPSTTPTNLGATLGGAFEAGMGAREKAQQSALTGMLTKAKIQEYQKGLKTQEMIRNMLLGGGATPAATTPQGALTAPASVAGPAGPTAQRAAMIGKPSAPQQAGGVDLSMLTPLQRVMIASMKPDAQAKALMDATSKASEYGAPTWVMMNGKPTRVQYNPYGQERVVAGNAAPYHPLPSEIVTAEYIGGTNLAGSGEAGVKKLAQLAEAKRPVVSVNTGQGGFKNEMDLKSSFKSEPIYKDYQDMRSAYSQIQASLKQETPIADTAAATKIMKLLDPGSVVRESELGMAMAATGRMDRLQNYVSNWLSGQKLTPNQRIEFGNLANELMAASAQAYNMKRGEYENLGSGYGLNANRALGPMVQVPSIMKTDKSSTLSEEERKKQLQQLLKLPSAGQ